MVELKWETGGLNKTWRLHLGRIELGRIGFFNNKYHVANWIKSNIWGSEYEDKAEAKAACEASVRACLTDARLVEALEWQPIETAPKDGTVILVCELEDDFVTIGKFNDGHWNGVDHGVHINSGLRIAPTHWMPLPDKPAEQEVD